jgi:hypothetical protein
MTYLHTAQSKQVLLAWMIANSRHQWISRAISRSRYSRRCIFVDIARIVRSVSSRNASVSYLSWKVSSISNIDGSLSWRFSTVASELAENVPCNMVSEIPGCHLIHTLNVIRRIGESTMNSQRHGDSGSTDREVMFLKLQRTDTSYGSRNCSILNSRFVSTSFEGRENK